MQKSVVLFFFLLVKFLKNNIYNTFSHSCVTVAILFASQCKHLLRASRNLHFDFKLEQFCCQTRNQQVFTTIYNQPAFNNIQHFDVINCDNNTSTECVSQIEKDHTSEMQLNSFVYVTSCHKMRKGKFEDSLYHQCIYR